MRRRLSALLLAALATVAVASPAKAITSLEMVCESGGSLYYCTVYHDAIAPATVRWYINDRLVSGLNDRNSITNRTCPRGAIIKVEAVVTDVTGSMSVVGGPYCHGGPWP
ncbi:hypothetical protein ACFV4N_00260 [Actinosynnema sp. NPDC059797]